MWFLFKTPQPEPYENYLRRVSPWLFAAATAIASPATAQQQPPQKPPFQLLIEAQIGQQAVDMAILKAQNDQLHAMVAERDKTIAGLRAEIEAKKEKPQ